MKNIEIGVDNNLYPTSSVIWTYTLLGGAIGGAIIGIGSILFETVFGNSSPMFAMIMGAILFATVGAIIGLVPSVLTGWFVSKHRVVIIGVEDYLKLFVSGFLMTVLCLMLLITALELQSFVQNYLDTIFNPTTFTDTASSFNKNGILSFIKGALFLGWIGGMSSIVLGKIIVPKASVKNKYTN